jgi:hypothetical protein
VYDLALGARQPSPTSDSARVAPTPRGAAAARARGVPLSRFAGAISSPHLSRRPRRGARQRCPSRRALFAHRVPPHPRRVRHTPHHSTTICKVCLEKANQVCSTHHWAIDPPSCSVVAGFIAELEAPRRASGRDFLYELQRRVVLGGQRQDRLILHFPLPVRHYVSGARDSRGFGERVVCRV